MGKLTVRVHGCSLFRPANRVDVSPKVVIVVDNTYKFQTRTRKHTFEPEYDEIFVVGNTHRLAVVEVSVYNQSDAGGLLPGIAHLRSSSEGAANALPGSSSPAPDGSAGPSGAAGAGSGGTAGETIHHTISNILSRLSGSGGDIDRVSGENKLLGRCYLSIGRLVQGQAKSRTYTLGTALPADASRADNDRGYLDLPQGVAGTITITLRADSLGEPASAFVLDDVLESRYAQRLRRLLLRYDKPKLQVMDLILGNVRDTTEILASKSSALLPVASPAGSTVATVSVNPKYPSLSYTRLSRHETFEELMKRFCEQYGSLESSTFRVMVRVDGCTNLDKKALNTSVIGSDDVYVILRTECECFLTGKERLQSTIVWSSANETVMEVVNPSTFLLHAVVMGKASGRHYEIGRTTVSVAALALERFCSRHMFLYTTDSTTTPTVTGAVHLTLRAMNFGLTPVDHAVYVDEFYDRLSRFFRRYDVLRLPQVDMLVHARLGELEEFMQDLVVEHGREPGSVRLLIHVERVLSLHESAEVELNDKEALVIITMGGTAVRTKARRVRRFVAAKFAEGYCFDVVRETDMIRIEVVKASDDTVVYGRVDFTCLNIQRGARNELKLYLVGNAGTSSAYFSGIAIVNVFSDEIGTPYEIDRKAESMLYGRLLRYAHRRMPENLHRVNMAVATVFDMESFMAQIAAEYGEEDPTYGVFFTVVGCRQLKSRIGGVSPYVVVRVGIDSYQTRFAKDNTEPDFFEFCEFFYDRAGDNYITIIVMDHSEVGDDREIGRAVVSLAEVTLRQQYHDFLPLQPPAKVRHAATTASGSASPAPAEDLDMKDMMEKESSKTAIGSVGVKFFATDLEIADRTRTRITLKQRDDHTLPLTGRSAGADLRPGMLGAGPSTTHADDIAVGSTTDEGLGSAQRSQGTTSASGRVIGGWMSKLKEFHNNLHRHNSTTLTRMGTSTKQKSAGGNSARNSANNSLAFDSVNSEQDEEFQAPGEATRDSAAVPTFNLMDEGVFDVEAFMTAPVISNVNSCANSTADDEEDGSYYSDDDLSSDLGARSGRAGSDIGVDIGTGDSPEKVNELQNLLAHSNTICVACPADGDGDRPTELPGGKASAPPDSASSPSRYLWVRVLYCKNLLLGAKRRPNPYLLLSSVNETHRTRMEFDTLHPKYNEEFRIKIDNPFTDYLQITALTDTPYGSKKLGHCVLSTQNVQRGEWHTRWASLVVQSHTDTAYQQGAVCLSLKGENFGLEYLPSADAENRLREQVRDFLMASCPTQLHRLEWLVGEYSNRVSELLPSLFGKYYKPSEAAELTVKIVGLTNLCLDRTLLFDGSCVVKIRNGRRTLAKTKPTAGTEGNFSFADTLKFSLENPATTTLRLSVIANGKEKAGECFVSLRDLHRGVPQERTHIVAINARGPDARPSGYLTVSLLSTNYGSTSAPPTAEEDASFYRLQRYLYYYKRSAVATVDIKYSATLNVNAYLRELVQQHGPEPSNYNLRLTIKRCINVHAAHQSKLRAFCALRCGLDEYRTNIVEAATECVFHETFALGIGVPSRERVEVILIDASSSKYVELGRTQVPLDSIVQGMSNDLRLPLVHNAGTRLAEVNGGIEVEAFTDDFGISAALRAQSSTFYPGDDMGLGGSSTRRSGNDDSPLTGNASKPFSSGRKPLGRKGKSGSPAPLSNSDSGRVRWLDGSPTGSEAALRSMSVLSDTASLASVSPPAAAAGALPAGEATTAVRVKIVGFLGLKSTPMEMYVRVSSSDGELLRTKPKTVAELQNFSASFETTALVLSTDKVFTLKLGTSMVFSNGAVCYADFCLAHCPPGKRTEKRLRLYECKTNVFLGLCRLSVDVPADALPPEEKGNNFFLEMPTSMVEQVADDLTSLVATYNAKDLRKLDVVLHHATDCKRLHNALRLQLCPSVVATVYLAIHDVKLERASSPSKHACTVTVKVGRYHAETARRSDVQLDGDNHTSPTVLPFGNAREESPTLPFAPLRVDITPTGAEALMTVTVNERSGKAKVVELARAVVSLRALLSPEVYSMGEKLTVPLVEVRHGSNRIHATLLGSLTFSIYPPAKERYPAELRFPRLALVGYNRAYVRYYHNRIFHFLRHYDANACTDLHAKLYETYTATSNWKNGLPNCLSDLVMRWGPEVESSADPPPLT